MLSTRRDVLVCYRGWRQYEEEVSVVLFFFLNIEIWRVKELARLRGRGGFSSQRKQLVQKTWGGTDTAAGAERTKIQAGEAGRNLIKQDLMGHYYFGPYKIKGVIQGFKTGQWHDGTQVTVWKKEKRIPPHPSSCPWEYLSLPTLCLMPWKPSLPPTHSFFNSLQPNCHLHTLEPPSLRSQVTFLLSHF